MRREKDSSVLATGKSGTPLMIFEDDPARAAEVAAALVAPGFTAEAGGPEAKAAEALKRERPSLVVVNEKAFADAAIRGAVAELGIATLVVVDDLGDPLGAAERLGGADDWIHRSNLAREGPARVARLLKRRRDAVPRTEFPLDAQFFALVIHDLRTPLNVIGLSLRMIGQAMPKGDPELDEDLRFVDENFRQIERMLAQLSDFYRLFERESALSETAFSPRRLVDEVLEARPLRVGVRPGAIRVEVATTCPEHVDLDPIRARMAIQYVLANALAASNSSPIRLILRGVPGRWIIEVAIDQPAPPSVKSVQLDSKSFERLCGFAAERRGMDLAIAAKVSELFGGTARLDVVENQGTTVVLDWPLTLSSVA